MKRNLKLKISPFLASRIKGTLRFKGMSQTPKIILGRLFDYKQLGALEDMGYGVREILQAVVDSKGRLIRVQLGPKPKKKSFAPMWSTTEGRMIMVPVENKQTEAKYDWLPPTLKGLRTRARNHLRVLGFQREAEQ